MIVNRRTFALGLGAAAVLVPGLALAAEDHLAEAISHTKEAIDHGKQGHAKVLVTHAEAAEKAKDNEHTKQGVAHLKEAIEHGEKGHAEEATKHAEAALEHLEQAAK